MTGRIFLRAVKALVRVTLSDSFRIRPRTEVSGLLTVQPAAKIQCPEPRVDTWVDGSSLWLQQSYLVRVHATKEMMNLPDEPNVIVLVAQR